MITVGELRELIKDLPDDVPIIVYYDCEFAPHDDVEAEVTEGRKPGDFSDVPAVRSLAFFG